MGNQRDMFQGMVYMYLYKTSYVPGQCTGAEMIHAAFAQNLSAIMPIIPPARIDAWSCWYMPNMRGVCIHSTDDFPKMKSFSSLLKCKPLNFEINKKSPDWIQYIIWKILLLFLVHTPCFSEIPAKFNILILCLYFSALIVN